MHSIHFYDESCSLLFLNDGSEIKLDFDTLRFSSQFDAQRELETWATKSGLIQKGDQIALLV